MQDLQLGTPTKTVNHYVQSRSNGFSLVDTEILKRHVLKKLEDVRHVFNTFSLSYLSDR